LILLNPFQCEDMTNTDLDVKNPISNEDAERGVLGAILLSEGRALEQCREVSLAPNAFHGRAHQAIYAAMLDMAEAKRPIDVLTLADRLGDQNELKAVGGKDYLAHLLDAVPTYTHAEFYIDIVRQQWLLRQLTDAARRCESTCRTSEETADVILRRIQGDFNAITGKQILADRLKSLTDYAGADIDASKTLLGNRFLCREGGMLFVGPSGVGKSSASVQQDILWAMGKPAFGIVPARPLRVTTVQAENDDGDLTEMARGIIHSLQLSASDSAVIKANTTYVSERSKTGLNFVYWLKSVIKQTRPDIVRLDPLQSYIGGDTSDPEIISTFVHTGLNPILQEFQCACIINHHTPKTGRLDTTKWRPMDWQYAGAGSAVLTNWARAIVIVDPCPNDTRMFRFIAAKRGWRLDWKDEDDIPSIFNYFKHAFGDNIIYWQDATAEEIDTMRTAPATKIDVLDLVPATDSIPKESLLVNAKAAGIGRNKARGFITELVKKDFPDASNCSAYLCGHRAMISDATDLLIQNGCPKGRIYTERFV